MKILVKNNEGFGTTFLDFVNTLYFKNGVIKTFNFGAFSSIHICIMKKNDIQMEPVFVQISNISKTTISIIVFKPINKEVTFINRVKRLFLYLDHSVHLYIPNYHSLYFESD